MNLFGLEEERIVMPNHNFIQVNNIRLVWGDKDNSLLSLHVYKKILEEDINDGKLVYKWVLISILYKGDVYKIDNNTIYLDYFLTITQHTPKFDKILKYDLFHIKPKLGRLFFNKVYSTTS